MRVPIWPGVRLSVWERQNPDAVRVVLARSTPYEPVRRVLSARGWMVLWVRYDWRDHSLPAAPDLAQSPVVQGLVRELHRRATHLEAIRGASADTVPNETWLHASGEVLGLQGALGIALGGQVAGGNADQDALEFYKAWVARNASEWNRCRCQVCGVVVAEGGR